MPDSIQTQTADCYVVGYQARSKWDGKMHWSFESYEDLNEALEFFKAHDADTITEFAKGKPLGALTNARISRLLSELESDVRADREHKRLWSMGGL